MDTLFQRRGRKMANDVPASERAQSPPGPTGDATTSTDADQMAGADRGSVLASSSSSIWQTPLTLAIVGGIVTLLVGVVADGMKSSSALALESEKFQADLIKKFLEPPDAATRRGNLKFLVDARLIPRYANGIKTFTAGNQEAAPQTLPPAGSAPVGIYGGDNRIDGRTLNRLVNATSAMLKMARRDQIRWQPSSGFLIDQQTVVTVAAADTNMSKGDARLGEIRVFVPSTSGENEVTPTSAKVEANVEIISLPEPIQSAMPLKVSKRAPKIGDRLMLVYSSPDSGIYASIDDECAISTISDHEISYRCDASAGSLGGAVVSAATGAAVAIHTGMDGNARAGVRLDNLQMLSSF